MDFKEWLYNEKYEKEELTPVQKANRQRKKNRGVFNLAKNVSRLKSKVSKDLSSSDEETRLTAAAVKTMLDTSERVGNKASAKKGHHGVTGLQNKHFKKKSGKVKLQYIGKSGMKQDKEISDKKVIKAMNPTGNGGLFTTKEGKDITNTMVNDYIREFGITSKDIRGYNANKFMAQRLSRIKLRDEKERKKKFLEILDEVAAKVGHTPSMLRNSYLHPNMEDDFVKHGRVKKLTLPK